MIDIINHSLADQMSNRNGNFMVNFKPFVCVFTLLIYIWVVFFMGYFYLPKDWIIQWWGIPLIATTFISIIPLVSFFISETTDTETDATDILLLEYGLITKKQIEDRKSASN